MTLNLATILRTSAQKNPKKAAVIVGETVLNYETVHSYAQRFAGALKRLGIKRGQHVALMLPNVPQFTIAYFGAHYLGTPVVPLNVLLTGEEVAYHLTDSDAVALIVWEGFAEAGKAGFDKVPGCKQLIVVRQSPSDFSAPEGAHNFTALLGTSEPVLEPAATNPEDTAVLLYTSGTTGKPKGAELTHFNMFWNCDYVAKNLAPVGKESVVLTVLPLFHSYGQTCIQNATLYGGGTIVLLPRFEPVAAFELMQKYKVNCFAGVPTMYFALLNHPDAHKYRIELKHCSAGGSAMPVEVMRAFDQKYGVNILEGYGLSETSPVASFNTLERPKKPGSIGLPLDGVEFKLLDEQGVIITQPNVPGEICIKGPNVMKGYYKRAEATAESIKDGWFATGDIAQRDEEGYYFIVDRKKDMIIRGGFNVYPREIEEVLYAHPAIGEAAVIGIAHESHGEEIKAVIAFKPGQQESVDGLITYCKTQLAAYKYPRIIEVRDSLPKTATGKILKRELRS